MLLTRRRPRLAEAMTLLIAMGSCPSLFLPLRKQSGMCVAVIDKLACCRRRFVDLLQFLSPRC